LIESLLLFKISLITPFFKIKESARDRSEMACLQTLVMQGRTKADDKEDKWWLCSTVLAGRPYKRI